MSTQITATPAPLLIHECQVLPDLVHNFVSKLSERMVTHVKTVLCSVSGCANVTAKSENTHEPSKCAASPEGVCYNKFLSHQTEDKAKMQSTWHNAKSETSG